MCLRNEPLGYSHHELLTTSLILPSGSSKDCQLLRGPFKGLRRTGLWSRYRGTEKLYDRRSKRRSKLASGHDGDEIDRVKSWEVFFSFSHFFQFKFLDLEASVFREYFAANAR